MRITKIENQKRKPGRKNIYADGQFLAGISAEALIRLGLRTGDDISPEQIHALKQTEELVSARATALRFLATRPRTVREVHDKLRERKFADEQIQRVISDLRSSGLLNDTEFTRTFIRDSLALKPSGRILLKRKLLLLGIDKSTVESAFEELSPSAKQEEQAWKAAQQFLRRQEKRVSQDPLKLRQRLTGFLARRGFTWDLIEPVVSRALTQDKEESHE